MQCRLCLNECFVENTIPIFKEEEETLVTKLIVKYLHLEIHQNDKFSTIACEVCLQHLKDFNNFFQFVEQRQKDLTKLEIVKTFKTSENRTSIEELEEYNFDEPLLDLKYVDPEQEFISENPLQPMETVPIIISVCSIREKSEGKQNIMERARKKMKISNPSQDEKLNVDESEINSTEIAERLKPLETSAGKNFSSEEEKIGDQLVSKYMQLKCDICNNPMDTFRKLKTHFRNEHGIEGYAICCNKEFRQRYIFLEHIQVHLNPDYLTCQFCKQIAKSRGRLKIHIAIKHSDRHELKFPCPECSKRFACSSSLNVHMAVHSEERNFICEVCNKGFKAVRSLKSHMHVHKETKLFVCETCGREYQNKTNFIRHMNVHQEGPKKPTEQCTICGKWYTDEGLQRHMECHNLKDIKCKHCGKILKSKVALRGHMEYVHRRTETYPCTFCEKTFKKPSVLKEHIAMHTGQKDYNCPHCPREFRSKANMYAHVKKIHVQEWAKEQIKRNRGPNEDFQKDRQ